MKNQIAIKRFGCCYCQYNQTILRKSMNWWPAQIKESISKSMPSKIQNKFSVSPYRQPSDLLKWQRKHARIQSYWSFVVIDEVMRSLEDYLKIKKSRGRCKVQVKQLTLERYDTDKNKNKCMLQHSCCSICIVNITTPASTVTVTIPFIFWHPSLLPLFSVVPLNKFRRGYGTLRDTFSSNAVP